MNYANSHGNSHFPQPITISSLLNLFIAEEKLGIKPHQVWIDHHLTIRFIAFLRKRNFPRGRRERHS